jgi:phosphate uptake regulator
MQELESVRQDPIQMGKTTTALLTEAIHAISGADSGSVEHASELEAKTDRQLRMIHDQSFRLITQQAPVPRDARLVTGVLDAVVDLELAVDCACEIETISATMDHRPPHPIMAQISEIGPRTSEILSVAIDGWRSEEAGQGLSVGPQAAAIRGDCQNHCGKPAQLTSAPGDAMPYVNLMLICRHLARISRHAACVAGQAASTAPVRNSQ